MHALALAFLVGTGWACWQPDLPAPIWAFGLFASVPAAIFSRWFKVPGAIASGCLWVCLWGAHGVEGILQPALEGAHLQVDGHIATIPVAGEFGTRFEFDVQSAQLNGEAQRLSPRIRLSWREAPPDLAPGQRYALEVVLKRPHGMMNPGGFDYEQWLFQHRIGATGYVAKTKGMLDDDIWHYPVERLRFRLKKASLASNDSAWMGTLVALAIGEQSGITPDQWRVLALTGTTHLIAISGMHITLIAAVVFFLARWTWSRLGTAALRWPAPSAAATAALAAAIFYALLAGFSIPTQRSLVMVAVATLGALTYRQFGAAQLLSTALFAVLVWDPFASLAPGFWLSFGAVGLLIFGMQYRVGRQSWAWTWGRAQWLVAVGMLPITLLLFQRVAPLSPLVNLAAVPWLSLVVTPLAIAGTLLSLAWQQGAATLFSLAAWGMEVFWPLMQQAANLEISQWVPNVPPPWTLAPATIGLLWWLAPAGVPGRWLGLVWCLPFLTVPSAPLPSSTLELTVLDVGQGLAIVARTENHTLVYDTGPRLGASFDTGDAVVVPFLRQRNVMQLDMLMVSHSDSDHAGGLESVLRQFTPAIIRASEPQAIPQALTQPCERTQAWTWDDVTFKVIHPDSEYTIKNQNNRSCVVLIQVGDHRILLTGDIERGAERYLTVNAVDDLRADILVAPHHGSAGASSAEFIDKVSPRFVVFAAGYRNRYGFPKPEPVARYQAMGAEIYSSAAHGAVTFLVRANEPLALPVAYRAHARRFWHTPLNCC